MCVSCWVRTGAVSVDSSDMHAPTCVTADPAAAMDVDEPEHGDAQVFTTMLGLLGVRLPSDSKSPVIVGRTASQCGLKAVYIISGNADLASLTAPFDR